MIVLHSVTKELGRGSLRKVVLQNVNWQIPARNRVLILGQRGSGKTTLLQIISGTRFPTRGWVERRGSIFNVGRLTMRIAGLTPRQVVLRLCQLYRLHADEVAPFVERFGDLARRMDTPLKSLPKDARQRFNYAVGYAIPFDFYLFDGSVGGRRGGRKKDPFGERCRAAFEMRSRQAGIIMVTSDARAAENFDGTGGILHDKTIRLFPTVDEAVSAFKALPPPSQEERVFGDPDDPDVEEEDDWIV